MAFFCPSWDNPGNPCNSGTGNPGGSGINPGSGDPVDLPGTSWDGLLPAPARTRSRQLAGIIWLATPRRWDHILLVRYAIV